MSTETQEKDLLRGGQFLVRETACEDVFTLEDLSEEQKMMRESTIEFVDRELWAHWERFEKKDYAYTEACMKKAGELGLLSVAVPASLYRPPPRLARRSAERHGWRGSASATGPGRPASGCVA